MKKSEVEVGKVYICKMGLNLTKVRLKEVHLLGGWIGVNLATGRDVRVKSAAKLRRLVEEKELEGDK